MPNPKIQHKQFTTELQSWDDEKLIIKHFISTELQDESGDIMRADGMEIRGKPVVLVQHGQDVKFGNEPVAKVISIEVGTNAAGRKGLVATTQYYNGEHLTPPDNTGRKLYEKAKDGTFPNWSIGFVTLKETPTKGGRIVEKWALMEYSQVSIGMNSDATTLSTAAPEVKFVFQEEEKTLTGMKCAHKRAHKALTAMHAMMVEDLKEMAANESLPVDGAEKCAKSVLEDFAESSSPHIKAYIKAVTEMEGNDKFGDEDEGKPEHETKDAELKGHQKANNELQKCYKAMVNSIREHKCNKEVDVDKEATKCSKEHSKAALPHATEFIKCYADSRKKEKAGIVSEIKSVYGQLKTSLPMQSLRCIFDAVVSEAYMRAWNDKGVEVAKIVNEIITEATPMFSEWIEKLIDGCRADVKDLAVEEIKSYFEKKIAETKSLSPVESSPAVPAASAASTPRLHIIPNPPAPVQVLKVKVEPPAPKIRFVQPVEKKSGVLTLTRAQIEELKASAVVGMQAAIREEFRQAAGRVTK